MHGFWGATPLGPTAKAGLLANDRVGSSRYLVTSASRARGNVLGLQHLFVETARRALGRLQGARAMLESGDEVWSFRRRALMAGSSVAASIAVLA